MHVMHQQYDFYFHTEEVLVLRLKEGSDNLHSIDFIANEVHASLLSSGKKVSFLVDLSLVPIPLARKFLTQFLASHQDLIKLRGRRFDTVAVVVGSLVQYVSLKWTLSSLPFIVPIHITTSETKGFSHCFGLERATSALLAQA